MVGKSISKKRETPVTNLIAYIPVLNKRWIDWLRKYPDSSLYLISQGEAEKLLPRLKRMRTIGLPSELVSSIIDDQQLVRFVFHGDYPGHLFYGQIIMPDEDVCHSFVQKNAQKFKREVIFEKIWARYDMTAVKSSQPIQSGLETTSDSFYHAFVSHAYKMAEKSPDWWRQVGAVIFKGDMAISSGFNEHFPCEYEQDALGDPALNREAGEVGKSLPLHAEEACIAECARFGVSTQNASIFVTCFPCEKCARLIVKAGIKKVFFKEGYSSLNAEEVFKTYEVAVIKINDPVCL